MLATELLFVYVYCLIDDAIKTGVLLIPRRPGPVPACTDAELLTIALVRHLPGRRSENGFLAGIRRDWLYLFPELPDQPEVNRRTRWLWGAFEQLRAAWAATAPEMTSTMIFAAAGPAAASICRAQAAGPAARSAAAWPRRSAARWPGSPPDAGHTQPS
jgi:hypothetical protein